MENNLKNDTLIQNLWGAKVKHKILYTGEIMPFEEYVNTVNMFMDIIIKQEEKINALKNKRVTKSILQSAIAGFEYIDERRKLTVIDTFTYEIYLMYKDTLKTLIESSEQGEQFTLKTDNGEQCTLAI